MSSLAPRSNLVTKRPWKTWPGPLSELPFPLERMTYVPEEAKVVYKSKDRKQEKVFDALEWIAAMYFQPQYIKG